MEIAIFEGTSKTKFKLLAELAKQLGIEVHFLTETEKEEIGLLNAIKKGKTGKYVDKDAFLKELRK